MDIDWTMSGSLYIRRRQGPRSRAQASTRDTVRCNCSTGGGAGGAARSGARHRCDDKPQACASGAIPCNIRKEGGQSLVKCERGAWGTGQGARGMRCVEGEGRGRARRLRSWTFSRSSSPSRVTCSPADATNRNTALLTPPAPPSPPLGEQVIQQGPCCGSCCSPRGPRLVSTPPC